MVNVFVNHVSSITQVYGGSSIVERDNLSFTPIISILSRYHVVGVDSVRAQYIIPSSPFDEPG